MGITITDNNDWGDLVKQVNALKGTEIKVGIFGNKAAKAPKRKGKGPTTPIGEYATYNEYGTKNIPSRPFFRQTLDQNAKKYEEAIQNDAWKYVLGKGKGFDIFGRRVSSDIQRTIKTFSNPPNAESTKRRKKSSNPLIDTGAMIRAVSWEVT